MKLIPMTDYLLEKFQLLKQWKISEQIYILCCRQYANFLKQPLKLGMFVPCYIRDGVEIPYTKDTNMSSIDLFNEWEQAKDRVLFEKFEYINDSLWLWDGFNRKIIYTKTSGFDYKEIEDLVKYNLTLTDNALKQIEL